MKHYKSLRDAFSMCYAIGSAVRLEIIEQILHNREINLNALAKNLHLSNGALTGHIKKLESAGLIKIEHIKGKRGFMKKCSINQDKLLIDITDEPTESSLNSKEIPLGLFCDYKVSGKCGLASQNGIIGKINDIPSFLSSQRGEAGIIWLEKGYLTYLLPQQKKQTKIDELIFTMELTNIYDNNDERNENVSFMINNRPLGSVVLPSLTHNRRGFQNPLWYPDLLPQYGSVCLLRITSQGTFFDGEKIGSTTPDMLSSIERFTIHTNAGIAIFGRGFGDYNSNIRYTIL